MPESFEKHFAQTKEEKRKTPEQIKEEKALPLAQRIREIKEKMKREGETIAGYEEILELTEKIKKIYEGKAKTGWKLEGKLREEHVLAEYEARGSV